MLQVQRVSRVTFLRSAALERIPRIVHGFSTRRAEKSDFTLGPLSSNLPQIADNRIRFLSAVGMSGWPLICLRQTHSNVVHRIENSLSIGNPLEGDAMVTDRAGLALGIVTADCLPILICESGARAVSVVHAGWRGTLAKIVERAVGMLIREFKVDPRNLTVSIGPHIGVCCYEVGEEVVEMYGQPSLFERRPEWRKPHLDLAEANRRQLVASGIPSEQVEISSLCTSCRGAFFFSYRRDGQKAGRMLSVIGIAP